MSLEIHVDTSKLAAKLFGVANPSDAVRLYAQQRLAAMCADYVPMETGTLAQTVTIDEDGVTYTMPYAHYQWEGIVYGPNIPIREGGIVVGFFSPPGKPKSPTGRSLTYSREVHPNASAHWLEPAMAAHKAQLCREIGRMIAREANTI